MHFHSAGSSQSFLAQIFTVVYDRWFAPLKKIDICCCMHLRNINFISKVFHFCAYSETFSPKICSKFLFTVQIVPFSLEEVIEPFLCASFCLGSFRYLKLCQFFDNLHFSFFKKTGRSLLVHFYSAGSSQCFLARKDSVVCDRCFGFKKFTSKFNWVLVGCFSMG